MGRLHFMVYRGQEYVEKNNGRFSHFFESLSGQGTLHFMAPFLPNGSKIVENKKA